jgi:hypothetical protein
MDWVYYAVLIALLFAGLFINLIGLPGLWVMVASALAYAWLTGWRHVGWPALVAMVVLAGIAELGEFLAGSAGAKKAGGSKRGMAGGIVGGLLGAIFLSVIPIPGVAQLVGAIIGTFVGVVVVELMVGKKAEHSFQIGVGAAKGRFWGTMLKTLVGVILFFVALVTAFPVAPKTRSAPAATAPSIDGAESGPAPAPLPATPAPTGR